MIRPFDAVATLFLSFTLLSATRALEHQQQTLRVPQDYSTIQSAITACPDGGRVLVAPGVYHEAVVIGGKAITLASQFVESGDRKAIEQTIISGEVPEDDSNEGRREAVIAVAEDTGPQTRIVGFTIRDGDDGIACYAPITIRHNHFVNNVDAIDYEGGGGLCEHNVFTRNDDDAIDLDGPCQVTIQHNRLDRNLDDGIEIRLQPYQGHRLEILIRENTITGNGEDGIQVIDYPGLSSRRIRIERNLIANNAMAGIGFMSNANTIEDFEAAAIPEPVAVVGNTILDSEYGIAARGNVSIRRNTLLQHTAAAVKTDASFRADQNLFWSNCCDVEEISEQSVPN